MKIRLTFIILAILSTIGLVLVLAKYPTGPHTINYNEPYSTHSHYDNSYNGFTSTHIRYI